MTHRPKLLILDDEAALRDVLALDFGRKGFTVRAVATAVSAIEAVKKEKFDVVVADVEAPHKDGIELLKHIRDIRNEMPVVVFLTNFKGVSVADVYDAGANAVFSKPFDRHALHEAIARAMTPQDTHWKRRSERVEASLPIVLKSESLGEIKTRTIDIARGGVFVAIQDPFPAAGASVSCQIEFPEANIAAIQGSGVVRWIRNKSIHGFPTGCGIEFTEMSESSRRQILDLINLLKTKSYINKKQ